MTCRHVPTVRVSSHTDLSGADGTSAPVASIYSCDREACIAVAKRWVYARTLRDPVVLPLSERPRQLGLLP